ncbi:hypothetical protein BGZ65_007827, partial [Modicella reniformis]
TMKTSLLAIALVLFWNCTFVAAFIDPISLSAAGAAVLAYLGVGSAITGTFAALFGTGVVATVSMINQKLNEKDLPELNENGDMLLLCSKKGYSQHRTTQLKREFCNYFVAGHDGDCDITFEKYRASGVDLYTACFHAYVNKNSTLRQHFSFSDYLECRVYNKLEDKKFYQDSYYKNNDMCSRRVKSDK